jgi:prepilin-type N-terminal cleavage/methylation domain-containing protein
VRRQAIDSEGGFSLAEILVTIAIVGITFTAILGGLMTSITTSAFQRKEATTDTVARSAAEWVKDSVENHYMNCPATYSLAGLSVPSGFSVTITEVDYWNWSQPPPVPPVPASYAMPFQASCPSSDKGVQRITIVATSTDGQVTETVQVVKRIVP